MLGASSSDEDDDDFVENDDSNDVLGVPRTVAALHAVQQAISPRSNSPAPSDSVSQANSLKQSDSFFNRRQDKRSSFRTGGNTPRKVRLLFYNFLDY